MLRKIGHYTVYTSFKNEAILKKDGEVIEIMQFDTPEEAIFQAKVWYGNLNINLAMRGE